MQGPGREGSVGSGMRLWRGRGLGLVSVVVMVQRHSSKWRVSCPPEWSVEGKGEVGADMFVFGG